MVYRCSACGAVFFELYTIERKENLDGENGWEIQHINLCPWCGCDEYEEEK